MQWGGAFLSCYHMVSQTLKNIFCTKEGSVLQGNKEYVSRKWMQRDFEL
jgi:hypothetical protein